MWRTALPPTPADPRPPSHHHRRPPCRPRIRPTLSSRWRDPAIPVVAAADPATPIVAAADPASPIVAATDPAPSSRRGEEEEVSPRHRGEEKTAHCSPAARHRANPGVLLLAEEEGEKGGGVEEKELPLSTRGGGDKDGCLRHVCHFNIAKEFLQSVFLSSR